MKLWRIDVCAATAASRALSDDCTSNNSPQLHNGYLRSVQNLPFHIETDASASPLLCSRNVPEVFECPVQPGGSHCIGTHPAIRVKSETGLRPNLCSRLSSHLAPYCAHTNFSLSLVKQNYTQDCGVGSGNGEITAAARRSRAAAPVVGYQFADRAGNGGRKPKAFGPPGHRPRMIEE
jgi:hypothetical protein